MRTRTRKRVKSQTSASSNATSLPSTDARLAHLEGLVAAQADRIAELELEQLRSVARARAVEKLQSNAVEQQPALKDADDEDIEGSSSDNAGTYLRALEVENPAGYEKFLKERAVLWGEPPRQPIARCVAHLCSLIIVNGQGGVQRTARELVLSERQIKLTLSKGG